MDVPTLLQRFERLNYAERMNNLNEIGRETKINSYSRTLVSILSDGSLYEQFLSLETCFGSRDVSLVFKFLQSPSKYLRKRAMKVIILFGSDEEVLRALDELPEDVQVSAVKQMRQCRGKRRRVAVVDSWFEKRKEEEGFAGMFSEMLPFASKNVVEAHLEDIDLFTQVDWEKLARYHPEIAMRELKTWVERSETENGRLMAMVAAVVGVWSKSEATVDSALSLLNMALKITPVTLLSEFPPQGLARFVLRTCLSTYLGVLVQLSDGRRQQDVGELILQAENVISAQFFHGAKRRILRKMILPLPVEYLLALVTQYPHCNSTNVFSVCTSEQKVAVYNAVRESWLSKEGVLPIERLSLLPTTQRVEEARRHFGLEIFHRNPADKIPYISMLPWEEAMKHQTQFLESTDDEVRSSALSWQILAAKYDDNHLTDAIQLVSKCKHEIDSVRTVMLDSIKRIPPRRWNSSHLRDLEQVAYHMLDADDLSASTAKELLKLVIRLFTVHPQWSAILFAHILKRRHYVDLDFEFPFARNRKVMSYLSPLRREMAPMVKLFLVKKDIPRLVALANAFNPEYVGKDVVDALKESLEINNVDAQRSVIQVFQKAPPRRSKIWTDMVPGFFQMGMQVAGAPEVVHYVSQYEPNLLHYYFEEQIGDQKVSEWKKKAWDLLKYGVWRWTPSQQDAFAVILLKIIDDPESNLSKKAYAASRLTRLPFVDQKHLSHLP